MNKQRLAEIMKEIDEGCEELHDNGVTVSLIVHEKQGEDSQVIVLGIAEPITADKMACSLLHSAWKACDEDMGFDEYLYRFSVASLFANGMGHIQNRGLE